MTRVSFLTDVATAKASDWIVYHTGNLLYDRLFGPEFQNVHAIATAAYEAYDEDRVHLVQKRIAPGVCAYIVIKREYEEPHLRKEQKSGGNRYPVERKSRVHA